MAGKPRFGMFKVIVTCPHCGNPLPVNGPQARPNCPSCQQQVAIAAETWSEILNEYLEGYKDLEPGSGNNATVMGELTLQYTSARLPPPDPVCPACQTDWVIDAVPDGQDGVITCQKCGRTSPTFPVPAWLKAGVPRAQQVFFAEREADDSAASAADPNAEETRPIALACPQCNGGLLVTAQTERTLLCKYCNVDVFLPDAVWLKLHPAKVAKFWLVRFQG